MKKQSHLKSVIYIVLSIIAVLISWNYPLFKDKQTDGITQNALEIIKSVGSEPHSFLNPEARKKVCDYLINRLEMLDLNPEILRHDSILTRNGTLVSLANIYVRIDPPITTDTTSYLLLTAHYDSTGKPSGLDSTRYSYGAADDGYGVGIIYGLLDELLLSRSEWKQGIKILFTDLEEEHTAGMKKTVEYHPEIFKNVNLTINVEARGVKGPALLFETSVGNQKIMSLYANANQPYAYSLTSVVYRLMPNYTDFGIIKDKIPGMNFAVIDNLNYYHTHHDRIEAVSESSLNHYATQLKPIIQEYLHSDIYHAEDFFYTEQNDLFFLLPPVGLIRSSQKGWLIINICSWVLFLVVCGWYYAKSQFGLRELLKKQFCILSILILSFLTGTGFAWIVTYLAGRQFSLTQTLYVTADLSITLFFILIWTGIIYYKWYRIKENKIKRDWWWNLIFTTNLLSVILFGIIGENFFILIPAIFGSIAFYCAQKTFFHWILPVAGIMILLIEVAFFKQLFLALTFGALGILSFLSILCFLPVYIQWWYWKKSSPYF